MFGKIDWKKNLLEYAKNEFKCGGMFVKIQAPLPVEEIKINLTISGDKLRPPLFYYGFECCMSGAKDPHQQYQILTGKKSDPGPDWGMFIQGWEMCMILRDGTDITDVLLVKQEVAIIFDLAKLSEIERWGLTNYIDPCSKEQWEEANHSIENYTGDNYWLVCRNKNWNGDLLKWLIQEKFPDNSYRVVPSPNL